MSDARLPQVAAFKHGNPAPADERHVAELTGADWADFIGHLASGRLVDESLGLTGMTRRQLEGLLRTSTVAKSQYDDAKASCRRARVSVLELEAVFADIAQDNHGGSWKGCCEAHFVDPTSAMMVVMDDEDLRQQLARAREIQAEGFGDEIRAIADDTKEDWTWDPERQEMRPNHYHIKRAQVMVNTRVLLMKARARTSFGDRKDVNVNQHVTVDHATQLEGARRRFEQTRSPVTIDGASGAVEVKP